MDGNGTDLLWDHNKFNMVLDPVVSRPIQV